MSSFTTPSYAVDVWERMTPTGSPVFTWRALAHSLTLLEATDLLRREVEAGRLVSCLRIVEGPCVEVTR